MLCSKIIEYVQVNMYFIQKEVIGEKQNNKLMHTYKNICTHFDTLMQSQAHQLGCFHCTFFNQIKTSQYFLRYENVIGFLSRKSAM